MSDSSVKFLVNGRRVDADGLPATLTLLQYLRQHLMLPGTKEGCAEGDCGACTVTVSQVEPDGSLVHRAVNSCIQFLPVLHGKAVTTVEGIAPQAGEAHPVQRAMVECHASQCGFCTPGFAMSLYADYRSRSPRLVARGEIDCMLSGNLCRCTGYRPIAEAACHALASPRSEAETARDHAWEERLRALSREAGELVLDPPGSKWYAPRTEAALARCLDAHPDARIIAGLTDVGLWSTKQLRTFDKLVYIGGIDTLRGARIAGGALAIGAAVTWTEAIAPLRAHWPQLSELLLRFASPPVRNSATVGGNLANGSPIGDSMPALIALAATIVLRRAGGERVMPLEDFYLAYQKTALAPGEYVAGVRIPLPGSAQVFRAYKVSKRFDQDISALCAGISMEFDGDSVRRARIAFGGMAATPKRAAAAERALIGRRWDEQALAAGQAALDQDFAPISDMRASAGYRALVARNLLRRYFLETARPSPGAAAAVRLAELEELQ